MTIFIKSLMFVDLEKLFKNKKITLMGLGLLGRGVGDAAFFAKAGADLTVTDLKSEKDLESSLEQLKKFKNIKFKLGGHDLEDFKNADIVVKAAGVPLDSPFIIEAQKNGVPVVMSTALFAQMTPAQIVGVTGTRGKSTVAYLLEAILKEHKKTAAGKSAGKSGQVFLGGNILGVSTLELLPETDVNDVAVLELDSWQLQGFGNTHNKNLALNFGEKDSQDSFSPHVAVFTTFMPDHMNYYADDLARYFADKANIYRFQGPADFLIISEQVLEYIKKFGPEPKAKVLVVHASDVPENWKIKIPGEHNRHNISLALAAAKVMGVSEKTIKTAVEKFKAAPGRLELIRSFKGLKIYNDTNATTPEATTVALEAFGKDNKTILIFGGADKKLDPEKLLPFLPEYVKALVVLPGTGTDKIRGRIEEIAKSHGLSVSFVSSMNEAVEQALAQAKKGDRILMSPAFASFGLFKNEYDRGDQFNDIVKKLK